MEGYRKKVFLYGLALALVGCIPQARVLWSPQGRHAAVIGGDGLYLCDSQGKLTPWLDRLVARAAWAPDGRHLWVARHKELRSWKEIRPLLDEERQRQIVSRAEWALKEVLRYEGNWKDFQPESLEGLSGADKATVLVYLRERHGPKLAEKLGPQWKELEQIGRKVTELRRCPLPTDGPITGRLVAELPDPVEGLRVSPDGGAVAYMIGQPGAEKVGGLRLFVRTTEDDGTTREVARVGSRGLAWSPDGRSLAYLAPRYRSVSNGGDAMPLATLARREVRDPEGKLVDSLPDPKHLAVLPFHAWTEVGWLADGRLLFAAPHVRLPAAPDKVVNGRALWAVKDGKLSAVLGAETFPAQDTRIVELAVSPDGSRLALTDLDARVYVLSLKTGQLTTAQPAKGKLRTMPTWRGPDELCFAVPAGSKHAPADRAEIVLWTPDAVHPISTDWPQGVVDGFLVDGK